MQALKRCTSCREMLPASPEYFFRNSRAKDGLRSYCKACVKGKYYDADKKAEYDRRYRAENAERIRENKKKWYKENRDRLLVYKKKWWQENRDGQLARKRAYHHERQKNDPDYRKRRREYKRGWFKRNPRYSREYYKTNRERILERVSQWAKDNPEKARRLSRITSANHRARKNSANGSHTQQDVRSQYTRQLGKCYYCNTSLSGAYDVDHVIPLSRGGDNGPGNIVLACPSCNRSKGDKMPHEWDGTDRLL